MNTSRSAFTLIEMLVVIALLTTLMGIGMAGMRAADTFAKETRTKTTISKLNQFVMEKYASYQYRRVPGRGTTRRDNLYSLMILEMPDHWGDIQSVNENNLPKRIAQARKKSHNDDLASAELLYQIVMGMPEAESAFSSMEIADTDGNGLNEFIDGWGNPIFFIRWPAKHCNGSTIISKIQNGTDPNPFDPQNSSSYAVFPLIFSAGPDHEAGITQGSGSTPTSGSAGTVDASSYYDNITNHNL